jgi:hypothetical protein
MPQPNESIADFAERLIRMTLPVSQVNLTGRVYTQEAVDAAVRDMRQRLEQDPSALGADLLHEYENHKR